MELVNQAMKCLENNVKQCVLRLIEDLIKNQCHNGYVVGREVVGKVKGVVRKLWLVSNDECKCKLLRMLRDLDISKGWARDALSMCTKALNTWLIKCGIDWKNKVTRNDVVEKIEDLLRRLGWSETWMCEELFKFIGIDVDEFRRYGVEPCIWLEGLEELSDLKRPYWLGLAMSDMSIMKLNWAIMLKLNTTNTIDAVFFAKLLSTIRMPSLIINWVKIPMAKYVHKSIGLSYYMTLGIDEWPWPIKLSADELEGLLNGFTDEELAIYVAGVIDGDGSVQYEKIQNNKEKVTVLITVCKTCLKKANLDMLKKVIAKRFGIIGSIIQFETSDALEFGGENAVRLLRRIIRYIHHPLRRLRAELILAYYDGRISREEFERLYEMTKYEQGPDIKRNHALEAAIRAAPQTHTHGG